MGLNKFQIGDRVWFVNAGILSCMRITQIELDEVVENDKTSTSIIIYNANIPQKLCFSTKNKCLDAYLKEIRKLKDNKQGEKK